MCEGLIGTMTYICRWADSTSRYHSFIGDWQVLGTFAGTFIHKCLLFVIFPWISNCQNTWILNRVAHEIENFTRNKLVKSSMNCSNTLCIFP